MTVTVKLITEQTTNQLVDSVNKAQTEGWFPVCGVVCFNARYTQLMAHDTEHTEVPKCNYFIVDSEDGVDFAQRVNRLIALNTGAVCLSSVQYEQARYIQAWGDDSLHSGGGGSGGTWPKWYTEIDVSGITVPEILTASGVPFVLVDGSTDGQCGIVFTEVPGDINNPFLWINAARNGWSITGDNVNTGSIVSVPEAMRMTMKRGDATAPTVLLEKRYNDTYQIATLSAATSSVQVDNGGINILADQASVFNSNGEYTNVIGFGSAMTLSPGVANIASAGGSLELSEDRGIKLYANGGVDFVVDSVDGVTTFGDLTTPTVNLNGANVTINGGPNTRLHLRSDTGKSSLSTGQGGLSLTVDSNNVFDASTNGTTGTTLMRAYGASGVNFAATADSLSMNSGMSSIGVVKDHDVVVRAGTVFRLYNGLDEELIRGSDVILRLARGSASAEIVNGGITLKANETNIMAPSVTINTTGTSVRGNVFPALVETDTLGIHQKPWLKVFSNYSPIVVEPMAFTSGTIPTAVLQKWGQVNPRLVTMAHGVEYRYIATDIIGVLGLADAELYGLVYDDPVTPTNYAVNQTACLMVADAWRRQNATREAIVESQERICGLVPGNGLNANHPLGDSGYGIRVTGKTNGDFDLYITDATPGRNMTYLYRKQTGTGIFEENSSQSVATTAAFKINTTDVNSSASVEVRVYVSDITTGRAWQIRIWPQSRTTRRYNMSIFEMTEGDTPTYRDYSL